MRLYKNKYRSDSNRLQSYDYSKVGSYFITICTQNMVWRFGDILNGEVENRIYKTIVLKYWNELPNHYSNIYLGEIVVMPNHIHFIISIVDSIHAMDSIRELNHQTPLKHAQTKSDNKIVLPDRLYQRRKMLLSKIIGRLKMQIAKEINQIENKSGIKFWQRNYYDRIIRNTTEYEKIKDYILQNPLCWEQDRDNKPNLLM